MKLKMTYVPEIGLTFPTLKSRNKQTIVPIIWGEKSLIIDEYEFLGIADWATQNLLFMQLTECLKVNLMTNEDVLNDFAQYNTLLKPWHSQKRKYFWNLMPNGLNSALWNDVLN